MKRESYMAHWVVFMQYINLWTSLPMLFKVEYDVTDDKMKSKFYKLRKILSFANLKTKKNFPPKITWYTLALSC